MHITAFIDVVVVVVVLRGTWFGGDLLDFRLVCQNDVDLLTVAVSGVAVLDWEGSVMRGLIGGVVGDSGGGGGWVVLWLLLSPIQPGVWLLKNTK